MISLPCVEAIFPFIMRQTDFKKTKTINQDRATRRPYNRPTKAFKLEVIEAYENKGSLMKIDIAERFGIDSKNIDHFLRQRRDGII